jgi:hypothetical protein
MWCCLQLIHVSSARTVQLGVEGLGHNPCVPLEPSAANPREPYTHFFPKPLRNLREPSANPREPPRTSTNPLREKFSKNFRKIFRKFSENLSPHEPRHEPLRTPWALYFPITDQVLRTSGGGLARRSRGVSTKVPGG